MNIDGKINVFVNEYKNQKGETKRSYTSQIANKLPDGNYEHMYAEVLFAGKKFTPEVLQKLELNTCYQISVTDGFLSFRSYKKDEQKYNVVQFVVMNATIDEVIQCKAKEDKKLF